MEEYFKCTNCNLINGHLLESKCCGNIYCSTCTILLYKSKCTKCKLQLAFQRNCFAERMLKSIKLSCKYNCGNQFSYEEMKKHSVNCDKRIYICRFNDCKFTGSKTQLMQHITVDHYLALLVLMENYDAFKNDLDYMLKGGKDKVKEVLDDDSLQHILFDSVSYDNNDDFDNENDNGNEDTHRNYHFPNNYVDVELNSYGGNEDERSNMNDSPRPSPFRRYQIDSPHSSYDYYGE